MNQRKILDLQKGVSLIAVIDAANETQVSIQVGKKFIHLDLDSVLQLRDWLTKEVLLDNPTSTLIDISNDRIPQLENKVAQMGLLGAGSEEAKRQTLETPLDKRKAVTTQDIRQVYGLPKVTRADGLEIVNLNGEIGKAREAFSPQNLNKDQPL